MPLISIIVPVYRVEPYLRRCVESILAQTVADFELILVDDGSPDRCGEICEEYAAKDARIRVIHQQNAGAAAARNTGLDAAGGSYIAFCDADDVVSPHWLEHMLAVIDTQKLVMPVNGYCRKEDELGCVKGLSVDPGRMYVLADYDQFGAAGIAGFLWNTLFDAQIVRRESLRLRSRRDRGDYNEDLLFVLEYAKHMDGAVYTGFADYLYDLHEGSLSSENKEFYFDKYLEKYQLWKQFILEHSEDPERKMIGLANRFLFPFMRAMSLESSLLKNFDRFKRVVESQEVQECIACADTSKENPKLIQLLKERKTTVLWLVYIGMRMKGRIKQ